MDCVRHGARRPWWLNPPTALPRARVDKLWTSSTERARARRLRWSTTQMETVVSAMLRRCPVWSCGAVAILALPTMRTLAPGRAGAVHPDA